MRSVPPTVTMLLGLAALSRATESTPWHTTCHRKPDPECQVTPGRGALDRVLRVSLETGAPHACTAAKESCSRLPGCAGVHSFARRCHLWVPAGCNRTVPARGHCIHTTALLPAGSSSSSKRKQRSTQPLHTMNSTLVVVFGSLRGGASTWQTLRERVLAPLSADLAVLVNYSEESSSLAAFGATHIWRVPEYADWRTLIDSLLPRGWDRDVSWLPNVWGPLHDLPGSGAIIFALRLVVLQYLDSLALPHNSYTRIILTRSDHVHACAHFDVNVGVGHVYVPMGESYGGVTDRHTVFHFADRRRVLSILPWLVNASDARETCAAPNNEGVRATNPEARSS